MALSPICPDSRPRWGKSRGQITRRSAKTLYLWALGPGPSRKPDSALMRLWGIRVPVDVGGCPRDADFRRILVGACRSESGDVGVGWGRKWGKRSRSDWLTSGPVHGAEDGVRPDKWPQVLHRSEWKMTSRKSICEILHSPGPMPQALSRAYRGPGGEECLKGEGRDDSDKRQDEWEAL